MIILLTKGAAYSISKNVYFKQFDHKTWINVRNKAYQFPQQLDLDLYLFFITIKSGGLMAQKNSQNG
jgi:hypothetical protein